MTYTDVNIQVPVEMKSFIITTDPKSELKRNALILYPYIQDMTISHGRAAEILGVFKADLIDLYDEMGIPYLSMDISEVEDELSTWKRIKAETA